MDRPLVYYCICLCLGCVSALIIIDNRLIGAAFTASFLIFFFITINKKFIVFTFIFFMLGMIGYFNYFNINIPNEFKLRITGKKQYYTTAEYKGRNINVRGDLKDIKEGTVIKVEGNFKKQPQYNRGIVGDFKIKNYKLGKKDLISEFYIIKEKVYYKFKEILGEEKTSIVMALCFGETKYINTSQKEMMKKFGVIHAFSVSGLHVGIIYSILEKILGAFLSIPICFLYILFTGIKPSCLRAFVMIIVLKLSKNFFKNYDNISALSLAAIIILIAKPYYIINSGFILSFLSTLGIILYYKKIERILYKFPKRLNESLSLTLSSQVYSFPYICFSIKNFGLGFILGNLILVPLYGTIVLLGNLCLIFIKIPLIFSFLSEIIYFILIILEGANFILDSVLPNVINLSYFQGIFFIIIYVSYIVYKQGYKNIKYLPAYLGIIFLVLNYNIVPKIQIYKHKYVSCMTVKYKGRCTMICNYDLCLGKEVLKLKDINKPNRIITNPSFREIIQLDKNLKIKILYKNDFSLDSIFYYKNYKVPINFNKHLLKKEDGGIDKDIYSQSKYIFILGRFYNNNLF